MKNFLTFGKIWNFQLNFETDTEIIIINTSLSGHKIKIIIYMVLYFSFGLGLDEHPVKSACGTGHFIIMTTIIVNITREET